MLGGWGKLGRLAAAVGLASVTAAAPARADLDGDARTLVASYARGGSVRRLQARLAERGTLRPLLLPVDWLDPLSDECVTVVVLGTPSSTFLMRFLPSRTALSWPEGEHPELSVAGAAQLVRCGVRKAMLSRLALEMRSPRGVVEVLVARGPRPFPPLTRVLGSRSPGALAPPGLAGPRAPAGGLEARVKAHTERARREGARDLARRDLDADQGGRGRIGFELPAGCQRVTLMGADAGGQSVDIDAELFAGGSLEPVSSDRAESPDAVLTACVGDKTAFNVLYQGASPGGRVAMLLERAPLPAVLPTHWSAEERSRLSQALRTHRGGAPLGAPIFTARGVSGVTLVPLDLAPNGCFVAAVARVRGQGGGVAISGEVGSRQAQNHGGTESTGTALAFCVGGADTARVTVEARGEGAAWLLAIFPAGRMASGEPAE